MGFPVFPLEWKDPKSGEISSGYREENYDPAAVVNMLSFLGWNPGTEHGYAFAERPSYDRDASERHWERLHDLFDRNLKGTSAP